MEHFKNIGVIGSGSFGTSLAMTLEGKGHNVTLWSRRPEQVEEMRKTGENSHYLPGEKLPKELNFTSDIREALTGKDLIVFSVPAQMFRDVFSASIAYIKKDIPVVNVAKGIEKGSLLRLSQVAENLMHDVNYVALSGPSHAEEVARKLPTTVAVASKAHDLSKEVQQIFNTEAFRVYTNEDLIGVELGGALKNIIALGAGISDGMGFGDNAKAALMTRGMTEMCRLGLGMGAKQETFSGLTGMGDLIVTCTSMHSRNRRCGILIGEGVSPSDAINRIGMVVEGISTAEAANELAQRIGVEMPITKSICQIINGKLTGAEAVAALMNRQMKNEMHIF